MGVFLLPLVLVKGAQIVISSGPQTAVAQPVNHAATVTDPSVRPPQVEWSEEELAAARHVGLLRNKSFGSSPLQHVDAPVRDDGLTPPDLMTRTVPPPDVVVRVILRSSDGNIALINGKYYRAGDRLGDDGWVVTYIDSDARAVHLLHNVTAQKEVLRVPMPR